jgi:hypothetical protein
MDTANSTLSAVLVSVVVAGPRIGKRPRTWIAHSAGVTLFNCSSTRRKCVGPGESLSVSHGASSETVSFRRIDYSLAEAFQTA